jgi:hypothetical protein
MTRYLIRQSLLSLVKLFLFATLMFFFIQLLMPGDWVDQFSLFLDGAAQEEMRAQLGLDLPIGERYLLWLRQLITLDLGYSFTGPPIVEVLKEVIPPTLFVFVAGTTIAFLIGLWLGKRTARKCIEQYGCGTKRANGQQPPGWITGFQQGDERDADKCTNERNQDRTCQRTRGSVFFCQSLSHCAAFFAK